MAVTVELDGVNFNEKSATMASQSKTKAGMKVERIKGSSLSSMYPMWSQQFGMHVRMLVMI